MSFSFLIRQQLAAQVGGKCSANHCRRPTGIPFQADYDLPNTGDGAHIKGSAPGTARFDPFQPAEERESALNGIWLCPSCHRCADRFGEVYPVEDLLRWKADAIKLHHDECAGIPSMVGLPDPERELAKARQFAELHKQLFLMLQQFQWQLNGVSMGIISIDLPSNAQTKTNYFAHSFRTWEWSNRHPAWAYRPDVRAKEDELLRLCQIMASDPRMRDYMRPVAVGVGRPWMSDEYFDPLMRAISRYVDFYREFIEFVDRM
jgi:hypothetical protein